MEKEYRICNRCVMDSSDPDIQFDDNGFCNHCSNALKRINHLYSDKNRNKDKLDEIVKKVKSEGLGNKYDCLIGLSGGVDSSSLAYVLVKQFGRDPWHSFR
jgi:asparagine synthetase B (glutamine-hydrolysing)